MAMPSLLSPLLPFLFSILCIISTTTKTSAMPKYSKSPAVATDFILASCRATRYPALCYHTLSSHANEIRHSERLLAITGLSVSLTRARSAAQYVAKMSKTSGMSHREFEAVKDCLDTMGDSVDELSRSVKELGHMGRTDGQEFLWHMSNVQTWVSAALTNENTCVEGFAEHALGGKVKAAIKMRVTNVAQVTSNALALVNRFASKHRTTKDPKFP